MKVKALMDRLSKYYEDHGDIDVIVQCSEGDTILFGLTDNRIFEEHENGRGVSRSVKWSAEDCGVSEAEWERMKKELPRVVALMPNI